MAMRSFRATFTGVENYVDQLIDPPMLSPAVVVQGITQDDSLSVVDYAISITGNIVRVEPTGLFSGRVDFVLGDV